MPRSKRSPTTIPRAPEVFVGRESEIPWLRRRARSHRVTVLAGLPGMGKSALVAASLTNDRALLLDPADGPLRPALADVLELPRTASPRALAEGLEVLGRGVILDGADDAPWLAALLDRVVRFGDAARLVALVRTRLQAPELAEHTFVLGPLTEDAIDQLVRRCAPGLDAARRRAIARASAGVPARARHLVLGDDAPRLTEGLGAEAEAWLGVLVVLERPLPLAASPIAELVRRCLADRVEGGVAVRAELRSPLRDELGDGHEERALTAARSLGGDAALLETVRLALVLGRTGDALTLLDQNLEALLGRGHGDAIFETLRGHPDPRLTRHLLDCACAQFGGAAHAWATALPRPSGRYEATRWALCIAQRGRLLEARETLSEVAHAPDADGRRAQMCLADVERFAGRLDRALALLDALAPTEAVDRLEVGVRRVATLAGLGHYDEAAATIGAIEPAFHALPPATRRRMRPVFITALLSCGAVLALERALPTLVPQPGASAHELFALAVVALERGRFEALALVLAALEPLAASSHALRCMGARSRARAATLREPTLASLRRAVADARDADLRAVPELGVHVWMDAELLALEVDPAIASDAPPPLGESPPHVLRVVVEAVGAIRAARRGERAPVPSGDGTPPDLRVVAFRAEAEQAVVARDLDRAAERIAAGRALAEPLGLGLDHAVLAALDVSVALLRAPPHRAEFEATIERLAQQAERLASPRLHAEVRLARWIADGGSAAELVAIADDPASPTARRRALALAGHDVPLDALDRAVLAARSPAADDALRIDLAGRAARRPDGTVIDLQRSPQPLAILAFLVRHGGRASKEVLVRGVWSQRSYHPLRDDKRVQVAIHRLRVLLERDPRAPEWLLLDDDGYRLREPYVLGRVPRR